MLTNYTQCIPLNTQEADKVAYKILLDNGTEFKNKLLMQVVFT